MKRNYNKKPQNSGKSGKPYYKKDGKGKRPEKNKDEDSKEIKEGELLKPGNRNNNPNWYFTDAMLADQVSQLSFQNLAGYPLSISGAVYDVSNINAIYLNPCPGVIRSADYGNPMLEKANGVNLAGFRLFSKLSAYTGRTATYAPQDISTMILAMGELISCMEWIRRAFGVANAYSMRNRSFPLDVLDWGMKVDSDDLFKNFANYRTRFNGLVTMINQLPIPKGIAYFEKCATLYEHLYLDSDSSMAQTLILNPFTTWILDEMSDPNGSRLVTTQWTSGTNFQKTRPTALMKDYLDTVDLMIGALLNSSTLQVVYTDLLNLSVKMGQEFWKLDYLPDGYLVTPEYNMNMLLQMHNAGIVGEPMANSDLSSPHVTKYNDVVPNPNTNSLFYNPSFKTVLSAQHGMPRTGTTVVIDMLSDHPSVEDRVEATRFSAVGGHLEWNDDNLCDAVLPDHYVVAFALRAATDSAQQTLIDWCNTQIHPTQYYMPIVSAASVIDWFPQLYRCNAEGTAMEKERAGDLNFYTVVNYDYIGKLHQFMALALYDIRSGK